MKKYKYMHLMGYWPAYFDGHEIVLASESRPVPLVSTLVEIHQQRRQSAKWRKKMGEPEHINRWGHLRVLV